MHRRHDQRMSRPRIAAARTVRALCTALLAAAFAPSQQPAAAELVPAQQWSFQCDAIRLGLRVTAADRDVRVRTARLDQAPPLHPFEIERRVDGQWRAIADEPRAARNAASTLTAPNGFAIAAHESFAFEVDVHEFAAVREPGQIRMRLLLEVRGTDADEAWRPLRTPWCRQRILPHEANATALLGERHAALRGRLERLCHALDATFRCAQNRGPTNPGPRGPGRIHPSSWAPHAATAEELLEVPELTWRIRARAHLALALHAIARARNGSNVDRDALREAKQHLLADELTAAAGGLARLPSGGLAPLQTALLAFVDHHLDGGEPDSLRALYDSLRERHPFFAWWWSYELGDLLR